MNPELYMWCAFAILFATLASAIAFSDLAVLANRLAFALYVPAMVAFGRVYDLWVVKNKK